MLTAACHCTGCQRMTAGPYSLSALYPADRFQLIEGETVLGGLKGAARHHCCEDCLSWLFTLPAGLDGLVNVRTAMLERASEFPPFAEFYRAEGLPGVASGASRSFDMAPSADEFLRLSESYRDWDGRPA
ncbi:MAG: GFA family protein [Pseudomonadota bacterium]